MVPQVDWKTSYLQNHFTDLRQTLGFARSGVNEINPLWQGLVKRKDYTLLAAGWVTEAILTDTLARSSPKLYPALATWRFILVGLNARKYGYGMPIITVRF